MHRICFLSFLLLSQIASPAADLLVSSRLTNQVLRYDGNAQPTGPGAVGGGLFTPNGLAVGPDGMLYVASRDGGQILRYALDGSFDRVFAQGSEMIQSM